MPPPPALVDYSSDDDQEARRPKRARLPPPPAEVFGAARDPEKLRWTRGFAHVPGNWPSHVYLRVSPSVALDAATERAVACARAHLRDDKSAVVPVAPADGAAPHHLSLSRPFTLRAHQIAPFVDALRAALVAAGCAVPLRIALGGEAPSLAVLVNDERTRTFIALRLGGDGARDRAARGALGRLVDAVDRTTARFGVGQPYYARPAFHVSLVSVPGDASEALAPLCEEEDDDGDDDDGGACPPVVVLEVREVECKIGNKLFVIPIGAEFPGE